MMHSDLNWKVQLSRILFEITFPLIQEPYIKNTTKGSLKPLIDHICDQR